MTRPKIENIAAGDLVQWARTGRIRVPVFQRSYQWRPSDVTALFDSILRGFPIGNLLVWQRPAPEGRISVGPLTVSAPQMSEAYWIVDGQQRITSLVGALTADKDTVDPRFRIYFDLNTDEFVSLPRRRQPGRDWLPVPLTLETAQANAWIRERPHLDDGKIVRADEVVASVRDYRIPMYIVTGDAEQDLREIFDRMNTFGKPLKSSDVFKALHADVSGREPNDLESLGDRVRAFGFGAFPDQLLTQSLLAIRGPRVDRDLRAEFSDRSDLQQAFATTEKTLGHVVDFLRDEANIPHVRLLPYALYVPVLARFIALFGPPQGRAADLLRRWIWRGAVLGVAPQGNTVGLRTNARALHGDPVASAERLLGLLPSGGHRDWAPDLSQTRLSSALGKVNVLGLLSLRPRPFPAEDTNEPAAQTIDIAAALDVAERPSPLTPIVDDEQDPTWGIANRVIAPGVSSAQVRAGLLARGTDVDFLNSHGVGCTDVDLLRVGDEQGFLARRAQLLQEHIADHVQRLALFGFPDGPDVASLFDDEEPSA